MTTGSEPPFSLTLVEWDSFDEEAALSVVRDVERRVVHAKFVRFEQHSRRVAVFDASGVEMVLVPGGRARLGFDVEFLDKTASEAWARSFEHAGHAAQQVLGGPDVGRPPPSELVVALRSTLSESREVEIASLLVERASTRDVTPLEGEDPHVGMAKAVLAEGFRLLTSDEWEYASSAGKHTLFRWGNEWPVDTDVWDGGAFEEHRKPNCFGLVFRTDPYHSEIVDDPWELRGGDGGVLVCGTAGAFCWVTFASAFRQRLKASNDRQIWFEQTHPRRALSITPRPGDGSVRPCIPRTVFDDAELAVETLTKLLDGGENLQSLPDLEVLCASHSTDARVFVCVAHAYRMLEQLDRAESAARSALSLSRSVGALTTLASVLGARGELDAAVAAYEEAIALAPDATGPMISAGDLLKSVGQYDGAVGFFDRALLQNASAGYARIMRLVCLHHSTGDASHARAVLEIARGSAKGVEWIERVADEIAPGWRFATE